jgi:hypothetical protein
MEIIVNEKNETRQKSFINCPICGAKRVKYLKGKLLRCLKCRNTLMSSQPCISKTRDWYGKNIDSELCICGQKKKIGKSFCYQCHSSLPQQMQKHLSGQSPKWARKPLYHYVQLFEEAEQWLKLNGQAHIKPGDESVILQAV